MKKIFPILFIALIYHSAIAQNLLLIPDTLSGTNFSLDIQPGTMSFYPNTTTQTMGVNGDLLGPTLILQKGDPISIDVQNSLSEPTTIHWHGLHVSSPNDGGPHTLIQTGTTWSPAFTVLDQAATYWYHPHLHKKTAEHTTKGIGGFIIVRDNDEASLTLPRTYGVDDLPLIPISNLLLSHHWTVSKLTLTFSWLFFRSSELRWFLSERNGFYIGKQNEQEG